MPDDAAVIGRNAWDAYIETIRLFRNPYVAATVCVFILMLTAKFTLTDAGPIVEGWIRAWRCG